MKEQTKTKAEVKGESKECLHRDRDLSSLWRRGDAD
jgi:hypothetical protein